MPTSISPAHIPPPDPLILERNLAALAVTSPAAARLIQRAAPAPGVEFFATDQRALGASSAGRQLCSRRRPLDEAARLAATVPLETNAGVVVLGFAAGHHLAALASRMKRTGVLIAFEPDIPLLRAVLERIDHSAWMAETNFVLFTDPDDGAAISAGLRGVEGLLAVGVKFLDHPPSRPRLGESAARFAARFTEIMRSVRTTVLTTLVQVQTTLRNMLGNVERYGAAPGVAGLRDLHAGRPAVVVSAGPSLHRNIDELARPGVRDRVVIIAVQTVLKTLLAHGIRPHFVTALDHAEVSKRFYEGLTAEDVRGITLVVEPKAHPAILRAWPGAIRCPGEKVLDALLGPALARPMGELKPGATVAHLAYYLARHLGCDPVILVGQDLGFTDGQYYSAGAAIHQVWSAELSDFNTLEMLEWQRIVRARSMLHRATDVLGRPVYTDEQMTTYRAQFERDFMQDTSAGLTVIDATEGGVAKRYTKVMSLREALHSEQQTASGEHSESQKRAVPPALRGTAKSEDEERAETGESTAPPALLARLKDVRRQVWTVGSLSRKTATLLREMKSCLEDQPRVNQLIKDAYALRDRVQAAGDGFGLVQFLNQTGSFNRFRADRAIELDESLTPRQRQARQIDRDITNVTWLADAADELGSMLDATLTRLQPAGQPRAAPAPRPQRKRTAAAGTPVVADPPRRVMALIHVDPHRSGLGTPRDLSRPLARRQTALALTLNRLGACRSLDGVVLLTPDPDRVAALAGPLPAGLKVHIRRVEGDILAARARAIGAPRMFSRRCWRAGIGSLAVFDEACCPALAVPVMAELDIDGALVVGADWALVDPDLTDQIIARYRENPEVNRLTFSQAPPGLAPCLVSRATLTELSGRAAAAGPFATIGGLLGYIPVAPQADPIAKPICIGVPPRVRDLMVRCIPDSRARAAMLARLLEQAAGADPGPGADQIAAGLDPAGPHAAPEIARLEISTLRTGAGQRDAWSGHLPPRLMPAEQACAVIDRLARDGEDLALSLEGRGDPLLHPQWRQIVRHAVAAGFGAIHVRTDLAGARQDTDDLLALGPDVISVDLLAETAPTYRAITGADAFDAACANLRWALEHRGASAGLPVPWIVPRITRCDAVYAEIETFYDRWLMTAGAAAIDPLPCAMPGQRIAPLPLPDNARRSAAGAVMTIRVDRSIQGTQPPLAEPRPLPAAPALRLAS